MKGGNRFRDWLYHVLWYVWIALGLAITLIPIIWVTVSSFRPNQAIFRYVTPFSLMTFVPTPFTLEPYFKIFEKGFGIALFNTVLVTAVTVVVGIIINSMAGFVFAKFDFPLKRTVFVLCLIAFMIPFRAIAIPLFTLIKQLDWTNSYSALIFPALSNSLVILMFRQFFIKVPDEFIDSARMDGASWWTIYWRIFMPLSKPAIISAGLILFLAQWLAFLWPLVANPKQEYQVVQVAIARLTTEFNSIWNQQFAATVITMIIPLVILMWLQKYYVRGVTGSGMKG